MEVNSFIPKPVKTGSEFFDGVLSTANRLTPLGAIESLYDSAKDVYNDYQKGDYKSLGRKEFTSIIFYSSINTTYERYSLMLLITIV